MIRVWNAFVGTAVATGLFLSADQHRLQNIALREQRDAQVRRCESAYQRSVDDRRLDGVVFTEETRAASIWRQIHATNPRNQPLFEAFARTLDAKAKAHINRAHEASDLYDTLCGVHEAGRSTKDGLK